MAIRISECMNSTEVQNPQRKLGDVFIKDLVDFYVGMVLRRNIWNT